MPPLLSLPSINSTNVRFMFQTLMHRTAMRASAALNPDLAGVWAERLFLTPPKPRYPESSFFDLIDARQSFIPYKGRLISTWRWGPRATDDEQPAVLLAHGWGGNAAQLRGFVFHLAGAGFRVIAYDQPAHGLSEGTLTGLPDFAGALREVALRSGGVRAIIGHSLGGTAAAYALSKGLPAERIVLVSPPADIVAYSRRFARWHSVPERVRGAMQSAIEERYGVSWSDLDVARLAPRLNAKALVIHDEGDRMVPWTQGEKFARLWPGARLMSTSGLGHNRILQAEPVWRAAVDFIAGRSAVAGEAHPAQPIPAPLY
jgi:pimeloyl-ACP methyl ester carboxylesterase